MAGNLANLRPWKPGQSGNPAGRPPHADAQRQLQAFRDSLYRLWEANREEFEAAVRKEALEAPLRFAEMFGRMYPKELLLAVTKEPGPVEAALMKYPVEEQQRVAEVL